MTIMETKAPKHGDERNCRIESVQHKFSSHAFSASEKYCEKCKSWGTVKGLVESAFCPTCDIPFDKSTWEDHEHQTH